jgi:chromosome partitioning protein
MRSIAWLSEKGGTGKTTSAVNTAVGLAKLGRRVLLADADPQSNASLVLTEGRGAESPTLFHVLTNEADAADAIRPTRTPGLDLLPAETLLADANVALASELGRERRLRLAMRDVEAAYDFVVVDTGPARSLLNVNVLNYAAEVWCPVDPGVFSIAGLGTLQGAVAEVARYLDNDRLRIAGLVLTRTARDNISRDVEAQLRGAFGGLVCRTTIPGSAKVGEAHARFLSVLDYAPRSAGAKAYEALVAEIDAHGGQEQDGSGEPAGGPAEADDATDTAPRVGRGTRRARRAG